MQSETFLLFNCQREHLIVTATVCHCQQYLPSPNCTDEMPLLYSPVLLITMPLLILATFHAFAYMSKAFAGYPLWQRRGVPVYTWLMSKQVGGLMSCSGPAILWLPSISLACS